MANKKKPVAPVTIAVPAALVEQVLGLIGNQPINSGFVTVYAELKKIYIDSETNTFINEENAKFVKKLKEGVDKAAKVGEKRIAKEKAAKKARVKKIELTSDQKAGIAAMAKNFDNAVSVEDSVADEPKKVSSDDAEEAARKIKRRDYMRARRAKVKAKA